MAIKSKTQLATDIAASTFSASQQVILDDMVDSYQDFFPNVTTVQRDALTPTAGSVDYIVWNTDNDRLEYYNGTSWFAIGADISTPITVKIDLSAADLATLFSVPVTLVAAPGASFALVPIHTQYRYTFGSTAYDFAGNLGIRAGTKTLADQYAILTSTATINAAADRSGTRFVDTASGADAIVENDSLVLQAPTSDPTTGDGTLTVWITYSIIAY